MKSRRDLIILVALFGLLILFTVLGPGQTETGDDIRRATTHSSGPAGTMALLRWMQAMGYDAQRLEYTDFAIDDRVDALLIINPSQPISRSEATRVLDWVSAGGMLIVVDDQISLFGSANDLLEQLEIAVEPYEGDPPEIERATLLQPLLNQPPLNDVLVQTDRQLLTDRHDRVDLLGVPDGTVMMHMQWGSGSIYISSASYPFTNDGLRHQENADLILNLLRQVPPDGHILFDEYHHGFFEPPSFRQIITSTAWGWALIYSLLVLTMFFILSGRRFGRPIPLQEEMARRSSAEYVESMADLLQRGSKQTFVQQHYYHTWKRQLGRPFGINPLLNDTEFIAELARYRDIDQQEMLRLFQRLQQPGISRSALLNVLTEADSVRTR
ncbi:MAG: DUF4350 domain-containing protein [Chloroflexaceae bacterium]|nr:DUF4350 domain-containing protein [Chloroflexaceae bacterium]